MLKNSLRIEDETNEPITCRECGKNLEESDDSEESSFCCNPIEADLTSPKFMNDSNNFLMTPKIGAQTIALRNKIETLQRRLNNLQARCDEDEQRLDKRMNCQSFANRKTDHNRECTCSGQMEMLKERINLITNKLKAIERNAQNSNQLSPNMNASRPRRIINHQIIIDDSEEDSKLRNKKVKQVNIRKPKSFQPSNSKRSTIRKTEIERRVFNDESPDDVVISRSMNNNKDRITKYRSGLKVIERSKYVIPLNY